jgi:hypothetical protein
MKLQRDSSSNQSKEEEKGSGQDWHQAVNRHGSFHTPMVKAGQNRRESSAWQAYNKLEERRRESESDGWGSDLRKQSVDYGAVASYDEIIYDEALEATAAGEKCYPLFLGGTKLPKGHTMSSMHPCSCSSLRCFNCDKRVHRFLNAKWSTTVDYLFVRNHNTNVQELQKGVTFERGSAAYACQCKFITITVGADPNRAEELKWMCGGH